MKRWIVEHRFAWFPVLIRNNAYGLVHGKPQHWAWLKRYTRVSVYKTNLGRYRTYDTWLGHIKYAVPGDEV